MKQLESKKSQSLYTSPTDDMETDSLVFASEREDSDGDFDLTVELIPHLQGISQAALLDSICLAKGDRNCEVSVTSSHFSIDSDADIYIEEAMIYVDKKFRLPCQHVEEQLISPFKPRSPTPLGEENFHSTHYLRSSTLLSEENKIKETALDSSIDF